MTNRYLVEQITGYFGLVFWSLQLAPQAYKTYRRGTSTGVSVWAMMIWTISGVFMGVYNIGLDVALGLWIQPQLFSFIAAICVAQEFRYQHKWSKLKTFIGFTLLCLVLGAIEVGLIFAFKKAEQDQNQAAITMFGVLPIAFILVGFLPQLYEIFRERRVIGLSHLFLSMDFSGSVFSTVSLVYGDHMDALDLATYISIAILDASILILYYVFEWYHRRKEDLKDVEKPKIEIDEKLSNI